ncbi:MAG TPA: hypothetical protein VJI69_01015 [Bacteroidia bacterium]|nr:hypothetical protein [Bacteroidia bacterium]
MKDYKFIASVFLLSLTLLSSCVKEKNFPTTPAIEFLYFTQYTPDSAGCVISFKDGDGDIGIMDDDATTPNDYMLKYLYKDTDGTFKPFEIPNTTPTFDTLFYSYRVPNLTPEGQYKALDGEILAKLTAAPLYYPSHTIVKFEIQLRDRAGHLSNKVMTSEIIVNP